VACLPRYIPATGARVFPCDDPAGPSVRGGAHRARVNGGVPPRVITRELLVAFGFDLAVAGWGPAKRRGCSFLGAWLLLRVPVDVEVTSALTYECGDSTTCLREHPSGVTLGSAGPRRRVDCQCGDDGRMGARPGAMIAIMGGAGDRTARRWPVAQDHCACAGAVEIYAARHGKRRDCRKRSANRGAQVRIAGWRDLFALTALRTADE